jgi:CRISPR-associated protein Cas5d
MRWVVNNISLARHPLAKTGAAPALPETITLKRSELQNTVAAQSVLSWMRDASSYRPLHAGVNEGGNGTPRMTIALKNVAYIIEAYPHVFDSNNGKNSPRKYVAMLERRATKGQCHSRPYLGCREFAADFRLATTNDMPIPLNAHLGRMLYDIAATQTGRRPFFFNAELKDGVMNTRPADVLPDEASRLEVLACSYRR